MLLEFIVWFILFCSFLFLVVLLNYWRSLFRGADQFTREELLGFSHILRAEWRQFTHGAAPGLRIAGLVLGVTLAWLLVLLGGLFAPDIPGKPDHASAGIANYFFQSALSLVVLHLIRPFLKEMAGDGPLSQFLDSTAYFFLGLGCSLGALSLTIWGVFHEINFLFCFLNMLVCLFFAAEHHLSAVGEGGVEGEVADPYNVDGVDDVPGAGAGAGAASKDEEETYASEGF